MSDNVNHPQHYGGDDVYEHQKVVRAWGLGYHLGNATKYICRAGKKTLGINSQIEDLEKALWYVQAEIAFRSIGGTTAAHFVYALIDPAESSHVRYVGKTSRLRTRPLWHSIDARRGYCKPTHKSNWIRSVHSSGREIDWYVLATAESEIEINELERRYIKELRAKGHKLTNGTDGGEGALGRVSSQETRHKMGSANRGKRLSEETRAKMAIARSGLKRAPMSEATKLKISEAQRARLRNGSVRSKRGARG